MGLAPALRVARVVILVLSLGAPAAAEQVVVAAAASMSYPIREIAEIFERETGHDVRLSEGSSGNFYSQILNGAPFDLFLSADVDYPARLVDAGVVEPGSLEVYATGRIVVWVRDGSGLSPETTRIETLLDERVRRVAIANPDLAPYGRAAIEALRYFHIEDRVEERLVMGDNVSQTAQFASTGAAQAGVLALSIARSEAMSSGTYWEIPAEAHAPIDQGMVILRRARSAGHYQAARAFRDMVRGPVGRRILAEYGFEVE